MVAPRIAIVGVGHFGREHLKEWLKIQAEGRVRIIALVVKSVESAQILKQEYALPVYNGIDHSLLKELDAVDIVTPAETHLELIDTFLPYCHVLVEKPVVTSLQELESLGAMITESSYALMVGHNYRFNPVIRKLCELVHDLEEMPSLVRIRMLNELHTTTDREPNLEYIHAFDLMDYLFRQAPTVEFSREYNHQNEISIRYGETMHCVMNLGWHGKPSIRNMEIICTNVTILCDLFRNTIQIRRGHKLDAYNFPHEKTSLRDELLAFVSLIGKEVQNPVSVRHVEGSLRTAIRTMPVNFSRTPRVAVIGGGVFGTSCALELDAECEVTLFERNANLMEEVSLVNQWRHHSGFHYPRSYDTIQEIRTSKKEFEDIYGAAVNRDYISYFCPSATGVEIPAERYLAACSNNYLSFSFEYPPAGVVNRDAITISLKTDEGVYDYYKLRDMVWKRLHAAVSIQVQTQTNVIDARLLDNGIKRITFKKNGVTETDDFDYLINATYSNRNLPAKWFSFPIEPLRFDLYELLILKLPIDYVCVTIIDGPFTSLVGMGYDNLFMLSHIHDSVLKSDIPADGMPPDWGEIQSNRHNMLKSASRYMPILEEAEVVESRYATRVVNAFSHDFDARPSVITKHGFGCWSVMGGKILTCVTNAREIADSIRNYKRR